MSILEPQPITLEKVFAGVVALILWLVTIGLGVLAFVALQDIVIYMTAQLVLQLDDPGTVQVRGLMTTVRNCSIIISGILLMIVMVGGTDYHSRKFGQRNSWRLFAWTIGIELMICLVAWVLMWR